MIDVLFEQHAIQNTGLAAEAIWYAVHEAYEAKHRTEGVPFPFIFLVLPLTFHRRTATVLAGKTQPGALYKALSEDREIVVGLQTRMQSLSPRTLQALSVGFSSGLLRLDKDHMKQLVPGRQTPPVHHVTSDVKTLMAAAKRVGQAFTEMNIVQMAAHLGVTF